MSEFPGPATADALDAVYGNITAVADGLGEAELMLPTLCAGWATGDLLYHQLLDARRALRTFASPIGGPADTDGVSYWRLYSPRSGEQAALGSARAAAHARHVRVVAAAYPPEGLAWEWQEPPLRHAAPPGPVRTNSSLPRVTCWRSRTSSRRWPSRRPSTTST